MMNFPLLISGLLFKAFSHTVCCSPWSSILKHLLSLLSIYCMSLQWDPRRAPASATVSEPDLPHAAVNHPNLGIDHSCSLSSAHKYHSSRWRSSHYVRKSLWSMSQFYSLVFFHHSFFFLHCKLAVPFLHMFKLKQRSSSSSNIQAKCHWNSFSLLHLEKLQYFLLN